MINKTEEGNGCYKNRKVPDPHAPPTLAEARSGGQSPPNSESEYTPKKIM